MKYLDLSHVLLEPQRLLLIPLCRNSAQMKVTKLLLACDESLREGTSECNWVVKLQSLVSGSGSHAPGLIQYLEWKLIGNESTKERRQPLKALLERNRDMC